MNAPTADRNLLFGILALQMDFIDREQLAQAMNAWVLEKSKGLGQLLHDRGDLTDQQRDLLETLVDEHLKKHDNDLEKSIAAVGNIGAVRDALRQIGDADIEQTLSHVSGPTPGIHSAPTPYNALEGPAVVDADLYRTQLPSQGDSMTESMRFHVLRPHAKGGLGQVSVAKDDELAREVALKEIQPQFADDPVSRSRFVLEAEITGGLEHPGIVPVYGLGQYADGRPYYAMRFIRGDNLKIAIERYHKEDAKKRSPGEKELEFRGLIRRFIDVCNAMEYAHSRSVLHRDLKPGNIMLGKYGETMVVDWGMAKVMDGQSEEASIDLDLTPLTPSIPKDIAATSMGSTIGTPPYMSPEQAAGRLDRMGPLSDIYGLGATFFHLLVGKTAFRERDVGSILQKVQQGHFKPPREVNASVPKGLNAICMKAMELQPENRYSSAAGMADDIEHWLADEPVSAMSDTMTDRAFRWVRRNRNWASTAAVAVVALTAVSLVAAVLVNGARRTAEDARDIARQLAADNKQLAIDERAAKEDAVGFLQSARQAVEMWVTDGSEALKYYPGSQRKRELFLRRTADELKRFADYQQDDPQLRLEQARALQALGTVQRMLGQSEEAEQSYHTADSIFSDQADNAEAKLGQANVQLQLGLLFAELAKLDDADAAYGAALDMLRALAKESPGTVEYESTIAASLLNRAALMIDQGEIGDATSVISDSVGQYEKVVQDNPGEPRFKLALAKAQMILARIHINADQLDRAAGPLEYAHGVLEALHAGDRGNFDYLEALATADFESARVHGRSGNFDQQLTSFRQAADRFSTLNSVRPQWRPYLEKRGSSQIELGRLLHRLGETAEAETQLRNAVLVYDGLVVEYGLPAHEEHKAACMDAVARVFSDRGKISDAATVLTTTISILTNLVNRHPDVPRYRERLAISEGHLGEVLHQASQLDAAQERLNTAVKDLQELALEAPEIPRYRSEMANAQQHLAAVELDRGNTALAGEAVRGARNKWEELADESPTADELNKLAWLLANGVVVELRDADAAVGYAGSAHERAPDNPFYATTLGVAHYRQQESAKAIEALREANLLREGQVHARTGFFIAMALWGQPEPADDEAESFYQQAVAWMEANRPANLELQRIRAEAEEVRKAATAA